MYASIRRFEGVAESGEDLIPDGRRLASALSREPGFVAYVLVAAGGGVLISVSVFEDEAGLVDADRLIERWAAAYRGGSSPGAPDAGTGEVIVQKGM